MNDLSWEPPTRASRWWTFAAVGLRRAAASRGRRASRARKRRAACRRSRGPGDRCPSGAARRRRGGRGRWRGGARRRALRPGPAGSSPGRPRCGRRGTAPRRGPDRAPPGSPRHDVERRPALGVEDRPPERPRREGRAWSRAPRSPSGFARLWSAPAPSPPSGIATPATLGFVTSSFPWDAAGESPPKGLTAARRSGCCGGIALARRGGPGRVYARRRRWSRRTAGTGQDGLGRDDPPLLRSRSRW